MKNLKLLSARLMALITCSFMPVVASADATAPTSPGNGDVSGGINFINWIKTIATDYAWALAIVALLPIVFILLFGGRDAGERAKSKTIYIFLAIFVLCCGNAFIQAARSAFGA